MTWDKFQVVGGQFTGRGLSIDASALLAEAGVDGAARQTLLVEIAEVVYRQGRSQVVPAWDDRFDLHAAADVLRALAVVVGPNPTGDRHRRAADIIARLLQQQEDGS